jgi:phosphoserine phosphatase RsbU/P
MNIQKPSSRIRFGLKAKLTIVLATLTSLALIISLAVSISEFKTDKKFFIFDTSYVIATSGAEIAKTRILSFAELLKRYLQALDLSSREHKMQSKQFFNQSDVQSLFIYKGAVGKYVKSSGIWLNTFESNNAPKSELFERASKLGFAIGEATTNDSSRWVIIRVENKIKGNKKITENTFLAGYLKNAKIFNQSEIFSNQNLVLVNDLGEIVEASLDSTLASVSAEMKDLLLSTNAALKGTAGVKDYKLKDGEKLLVALAPVQLADLFLLSITPESKAFAAMKLLIVKVSLFLIALICFVIGVSVLLASKITSGIQRLVLATESISSGNLDIELKSKSEDEIGLLTSHFVHMVKRIKVLLLETAEKSRMENELLTAKTVQANLFPREGYVTKAVEVEGMYVPASECSGDWWFYLPMGNKLFVFMGDATGHGVPSALLTSAAKSAASLIHFISDRPLPEIMSAFNRSIFETSNGEMMMTFFMGCLDFKTGEFEYCNASHEMPILLQNSKKPLSRDSIQFLDKALGPRLGENLNAFFKSDKIILNRGDRIVVYTDGVTELVNAEGRMFGERKLLSIATQTFNNTKNLKDSIHELSNDIDIFRNQAPLKDDCTYFMIQYKGLS